MRTAPESPRPLRTHARALGSAGAEQPGQPDDLAGAHREGGVAQAAAAGQALHVEQRCAGLDGRGRGVDRLREFAAEHRGDEVDLGDVLHVRDLHRAPVPHHGDPVADGVELVELVAHEDHRHALRLELADDAEEDRHLPVVERGGGLVHDDEPRLETDGACDRHHLLHGGGVVHQRTAHVDALHREARQQGARLGVHRRPVEQSESRFSRPREMFSVTER